MERGCGLGFPSAEVLVPAVEAGSVLLWKPVTLVLLEFKTIRIHGHVRKEIHKEDRTCSFHSHKTHI